MTDIIEDYEVDFDPYLDDEPDEAFQWEDYDVGFDPYLGLYTDDC